MIHIISVKNYHYYGKSKFVYDCKMLHNALAGLACYLKLYILWLALELIFLAAMRHCEWTLASSGFVALEGIK